MDVWKLTLRLLVVVCVVWISYALITDDAEDPGLDPVKAFFADLFSKPEEPVDKPVDLAKTYKILVIVAQPQLPSWDRYLRPMRAATDQTMWFIQEKIEGPFSLIYDDESVTILDALDLARYLDVDKHRASICSKAEQRKDYGLSPAESKCKSTYQSFHNIHVDEADMIVTLGNVDVPFLKAP